MKKIIIVNSILILSLLIFFELFINIFKLSGIMGIDSAIFLNQENSYSFKKNFSGKVYGKTVYTDDHGFRIPNKEFRYDQKKSSIVFIGDSTTFGNGVDEEKTFVGKLRIKKKEFNFYNTAVIGYQIFHHTKNIHILDKLDKINKVFYIFTLNDVFEIDQIQETEQEKIKISNENFANKLKNIKLFNYINMYLRNKSYLYMFIKGIGSDPAKRYFDYVKNYYKQKKIYEKEIFYFSKLKNKLSKKNISFTVLILPYEYQTRKDKCFKENLEPQIKITKILKSLQINYLDYTKLFCNNRKPKNLFYKFDPMHLSENGHDLVFYQLEKEI